MTDLTRVAVVTGSGSGIGAAVSAELMLRGWIVAGLDLKPSPACSLSIEVDMADPERVGAAIRSVETELGVVSAAVSAAGYYEMAPISEITGAQWRRMLAVHLGGFLHLSRSVLPQMLASSGGSIVAIGSELAVGGGGPGDAHYSAAKGALLGLMRSLAVEMAPHGVRVNAVAPGPTDTPLLAADSPWRDSGYLSTLPIGRLASPEEVALCVAFLVDEGSFCVGETLNPNSGAVI
jgi:NAD(P)-dependent dehydrogenase (short-subunit alcohol dehydrogenase family)